MEPRLKVDELLKTLAVVKEMKKGDDGYIHFRAEYYGPGQIKDSYKVLSYQSLAFIAVEFENSEIAKNEAVRLNQYYHRNWLFDEVRDEPILKDLVVYQLKAINPNDKSPWVPRHHPKGDSPPGGAGGGH